MALSSTVRAIGGASFKKECKASDLAREVFSVKTLNHTNMARSFGLYKEMKDLQVPKDESNILFTHRLKLSTV